MIPNVVLVTGVGGYLGGNVAARLAANPDIERVIGVDTVPPRRLADVIGHGVDTALTRYLAMPVVPTVLGYDARVQLLHGEDALAVLDRARVRDLPGVYNAGADGVLMLSQAIRRAGRVPLPVPRPAVPVLAKLIGGTRPADFSPDLVRYLNFGRVVDNTRLKTIFGFTPRWTRLARSTTTCATGWSGSPERRLLAQRANPFRG